MQQEHLKQFLFISSLHLDYNLEKKGNFELSDDGSVKQMEEKNG